MFVKRIHKNIHVKDRKYYCYKIIKLDKFFWKFQFQY